MKNRRENLKITWRDICFMLMIVILFVAAVLLVGCDRGLRKENERLREELARQQQYVPLQRDTIRDTVEVVTQRVVEVERIKDVLTAEDKELLKDVGVKVKELESYQKTGIETKDTVYLQADSTSQSLTYHDAWADFEYYNRMLRYSVRDSLAIAVKKEYKHRFLWWRWGTKGYEVKAVNFNPHSTIRYNTYVKQRK